MVVPQFKKVLSKFKQQDIKDVDVRSQIDNAYMLLLLKISLSDTVIFRAVSNETTKDFPTRNAKKVQVTILQINQPKICTLISLAFQSF
jgi:hypothetical protein